MDGSVRRRGRPCWYLYENRGTAAINDGQLLEQGLYQLLSRYFRDKPYYTRVLELFHDVSLIFISKIRDNWTVDLGKTRRNGIEKEVQRTVIVKLKIDTWGECKRRIAKGCGILLSTSLHIWTVLEFHA